MLGSDDLHDDSIDAVLCRGAGPPGSAAIREAVLSQTIGVIRFRRRLRKCILAMSLAGCYVAGLATAGLLTPIAGGASSPPAIASPLRRPNVAPNRGAGSVKLARDEIIRREADRCLFEHGDVKEAVRQYDRFLKIASAEQRAIAPQQDSWLLMALKDARSKELRHDHSSQN
jgi:hypothetical protein